MAAAAAGQPPGSLPAAVILFSVYALVDTAAEDGPGISPGGTRSNGSLINSHDQQGIIETRVKGCCHVSPGTLGTISPEGRLIIISQVSHGHSAGAAVLANLGYSVLARARVRAPTSK